MNQNKSEPELVKRAFLFTQADLDKLQVIAARRTLDSSGKKKQSLQETLAELIREKFDNSVVNP